jgi:uncharacterized protein involved in exopolysaccharide biosynthesis
MAVAHDRELVTVPQARAIVAPLFRHRRGVLLTFVFVAAVAVTTAVTLPPVYESQFTILVKRERFDPLLTADSNAAAIGRVEVAESELYTEMELLRSQELLERVVATRQSAAAEGSGPLRQPPDRADTSNTDARAADVERLRARLTVTPIRKTTMIAVNFRSSDARDALTTLETMSRLYLDQHLAMHRPAGAHDFFKVQTAQARAELDAAQAALSAFAARERVVSAATEREAAIQKVGEFEAGLQQIEASVADGERRLRSIAGELASTPDRQVTQIRNSANVELVRDIRARLLQLEVKRQELLNKFNPTYPPVVELQQEIARLQAAINTAEAVPLRDETTDQNPTFQWLRNEQARVRTERDALVARATAMRRSIDEYRQRAERLDAQSVEEAGLLRQVKAAEEHYLLYQRKQEEARISDALDQRRIANVVIADAPRVAPAPVGPPRLVLIVFGLMLAGVCSAGVAFYSHKMHPYFRTPDEVLTVLDIPVLATLPAASDVNHVRVPFQSS